MDIIARGGVIMVLIVLLSVVAAVIIIERLLYLRSSRADDARLLERLGVTMSEGRYEEALAICDNRPSPLASLMRTGIENRHQARSELREVILAAASLEIPKQERFLSALGTIATIAPLLGLLGTVTGNISAFGVLGGLAGIADAPQLAQGISEALLTTAAGIIASIPATVFYNYLVNKVNHRTIQLENRVNHLVLLLADAERATATGGRLGQRTGDRPPESSER